MSLQITLDFLQALAQNNNREWFNDHRKQYDEARGEFEALIAEVLGQFANVDSTIGAMHPEETMFRINRDVRFSKDKSPYKTGMSALIGPQGRKSNDRYYYISIEPGHQSLVASGLKSPDSATLQLVREAIAKEAKPLRDILEAESFKGMFHLDGEQLKTAPKGFPKDHPNVDLLCYKEFMAHRPFTDDEVIRPDFVEQVIVTCQALKPLTMYFHNVLRDHTMPTRDKH